MSTSLPPQMVVGQSSDQKSANMTMNNVLTIVLGIAVIGLAGYGIYHFLMKKPASPTPTPTPSPTGQGYSCQNGICVIDANGEYSDLDACNVNCTTPAPSPQPSPSPSPKPSPQPKPAPVVCPGTLVGGFEIGDSSYCQTGVNLDKNSNQVYALVSSSGKTLAPGTYQATEGGQCYPITVSSTGSVFCNDEQAGDYNAYGSAPFTGGSIQLFKSS